MFVKNIFRASLFVVSVVFCLSLNGLAYDPCVDCPPNLSTIPGAVEYQENWNLQWGPNNPDEMNQNDSVTLNVIGGFSPYLWTVSGNGFWLEESQTEGLSNILYSDGSACGSATIIVTDSRNGSVEGSVRILDHGQWVEIAPSCLIPGPANSGPGERIEGKYKQFQQYEWCWFCSSGQVYGCPSCSDSSRQCNNMPECITFNCPPEFPNRGDEFCCYNDCAGDLCGEVYFYRTRSFRLYEWKCN